MSIYDESFNEPPPGGDKSRPDKTGRENVGPGDPGQGPEDSRPKPPIGGLPSEPASGGQHVPVAEPVDGDDQANAPSRRRGCGCGSCLLALLVMSLLGTVLCVIGGYLGYQRAPDWAHGAIVAAVNDSQLDPAAKREITADMDRLLDAYKRGEVTQQRIGEALEELGDSPLPVLMMAYAARENFIEPSGLTDDEKADAKLAFERVARGTFEQSIDPDDLETALDYISKKDFNGNRQLKSRVSDEELRALIAECHRVADEADVPNEPYEVDAAAIVKRIVDRALGTAPADAGEEWEQQAIPAATEEFEPPAR